MLARHPPTLSPCCLRSSHTFAMPSSRLSSRYTSQSKPVPPTSPRSLPATLLHVVAFLSLSNSFRLLFQPSPVNDFMESQKGGHWSFLTVLR